MSKLSFGISLLGLICLPAFSLDAQIIRGIVREDPSGSPIPGAAVRLINAEDDTLSTIMSDEEGNFSIALPAPGHFRLSVVRLGYTPANSGLFQVGENDEPSVDIYLTAAPVSMDTVDVVGEVREPKLESVGFYERLEEGIGYFVTREEIEGRPIHQATDLLYGFRGGRVTIVNSLTNEYDVIMRAGATSYIRGGRAPQDAVCFPAIVIDGVVVRHGGVGVEIGSWNALVDPAEIEALEAYSNPSGIPVRYAGMRTPCGAILIWTRR